MRCGKGSLDLVMFFLGQNRFGCSGRMWVELKAWGLRTFDKNLADAKETLPSKLDCHRKSDPTLCAVLLLAAKVSQTGGHWGKPELCGFLSKGSGTDWVYVCGTAAAKGRGQVRGTKRPLSDVRSFLIKWY